MDEQIPETEPEKTSTMRRWGRKKGAEQLQVQKISVTNDRKDVFCFGQEVDLAACQLYF